MSLVMRIPQAPGPRAASWRAKEFREWLRPSSSEEKEIMIRVRREQQPYLQCFSSSKPTREIARTLFPYIVHQPFLELPD